MAQDISGKDSIWIGNYGYYNEGYLVGAWLPLPYDPADLDDFLKNECGVDRFHEEYGIFDTNFEGAMGEMGVRAGEYDSIEDLNLLAEVIESAGPVNTDAVREYMAHSGADGILEYANAVMQADEIPYFSWEDSSDGYSSDEEHYAYQMVSTFGGLEHMGRETLEEHFDYEAYGRSLEQGLYVDDNGYILAYGNDIDSEYYSLDEIVDGIDAESFEAAEVESARSELKEDWGLSGSAVDDAEDIEVMACMAVLDGLADTQEEAVRLYSSCHLSSLDGPVELANVAMQADDIAYTQFDPSVIASSTEERIARQEIEVTGGLSDMPRDELEQYFDYEEYGQYISYDIVFADDGYLDTSLDGPDLNEYSREDLMEEVGLSFDDESPAEVGQVPSAVEAAREAALIMAGTGHETAVRDDMER